MSVADSTMLNISASPTRQRTPRRRTSDNQIPLCSTTPLPPLPSPSALPRRSVSSMGREENSTNAVNMMSSPPLLRRRAFSCDDETQQNNGSAVSPPRTPLFRGLSALSYNSQVGSSSVLRTIPSRSDMEDDDRSDSSNHRSFDEGDGGRGLDSVRRHTLFSTPTRSERGAVAIGTQRSINNNRGRAVSSDVILDIQSCVPSYDDELASRIASISTDDHYFDEEQRAASFSTPERQMIARSTMMGRERANTCPHRPQRHMMFGQECLGIKGDEESGQIEDQSADSEILIEYGGSSVEGTSPDLNNSFTPRRTHNLSSERSMGANYSAPLMSSPGRRRRTTSHEIPLPTFASPSPSSSAAARRTTPARLPLSSPLSTPTPNTNVTASIVEIPNSPHIRSRSQTQATSSSTTPIVLTATQQAHAQAHNFIFSLNPHLIKALMIISLYSLLSYTWNTDYRFRYKSVEINYGLSEYWHGGLGRSVGAVEKIGRHTRGKLFNDDGDDGGIVKLMNRGLEEGDDKLDGEDSASADDVAASSSGEDGLPVLFATSINDKAKRRPALSHARSQSLMNGVQQRAIAARRPPPSKWTLSRLAWAMAWVAFMLPIVEAGMREVRRVINVRFGNVRGLRSLRAVPGRVRNVRNL